VGWLIVYTPEEEQTAKVAVVAKQFNARSAVRYGHLVQEELV
jgi:hypothetical protein